MDTRTNTPEHNVNHCPITGTPITPPHTISHTAANQLATAARTLPQLMRTVDYALQGLRNGTANTPTGYTSHPPINLSLLEEIDDMRDALNTWAAELAQHVNPHLRYRNGDWQQASQIFIQYAPKATTWMEAPQMVDECQYAINQLEHLASIKPNPGAYVGKCENCDTDLITHVNADTTQCRKCGHENNNTERHRAMLTEAGNRPLPPRQAREIAELITRKTIPHNTVKTWIRRGKLTPNQNGHITARQIIETLEQTS